MARVCTCLARITIGYCYTFKIFSFEDSIRVYRRMPVRAGHGTDSSEFEPDLCPPHALEKESKEQRAVGKENGSGVGQTRELLGVRGSAK